MKDFDELLLDYEPRRNHRDWIAFFHKETGVQATVWERDYSTALKRLEGYLRAGVIGRADIEASSLPEDLGERRLALRERLQSTDDEIRTLKATMKAAGARAKSQRVFLPQSVWRGWQGRLMALQRLSQTTATAIARTNAEIRQQAKPNEVHSCHDQCARPMCVLRRERDAARREAEQAKEEIATLREENEQQHSLIKTQRQFTADAARKLAASAAEALRLRTDTLHECMAICEWAKAQAMKTYGEAETVGADMALRKIAALAPAAAQAETPLSVLSAEILRVANAARAWFKAEDGNRRKEWDELMAATTVLDRLVEQQLAPAAQSQPPAGEPK